MANKYKDNARKLNAQEGEIVLTYGVDFINNPNVKPHRHNQERPYLVLHKEESGKFLALKMTSKIRGYMSEFKIYPKDYENSSILTRPSAADTRFIYELEGTDIIKNGFVLPEKEIDNLYSKIINLYCLDESETKKEQVKIIFDKYMNNRTIIPGTVLKVRYRKEYLFVIEITEENYVCVPLYREKNKNTHGSINLFKEPSYIDFNEEYTISKKDICYIMRFRSDEDSTNYVLGRVNSRRRYHENQQSNDNLKKSLISNEN